MGNQKFVAMRVGLVLGRGVDIFEVGFKAPEGNMGGVTDLNKSVENLFWKVFPA
jgi:hypothetical protein